MFSPGEALQIGEREREISGCSVGLLHLPLHPIGSRMVRTAHLPKQESSTPACGDERRLVLLCLPP